MASTTRSGPAADDRWLVELVIRLGRENRSWGCVRIQGELRKLGIRVSASSIRRVLRRHGLGPGPRSGPTWSEFLRVQAHSVLAMDFFAVDTVSFAQLYALFVIELSIREVHILGVTDHPTGVFVTQVARNLMGDLADRSRSIKFLVRDRDAKFTASFDEVFASEGIRVIKTPSVLLGRTPTRNDGSGPFGPNASTGCSSSVATTWRGFFARTSPTTTNSAHTEALILKCRWQLRDRRHSPIAPCPSSRRAGRPHPRVLLGGRVARPTSGDSSVSRLGEMQSGTANGGHESGVSPALGQVPGTTIRSRCMAYLHPGLSRRITMPWRREDVRAGIEGHDRHLGALQPRGGSGDGGHPSSVYV
jgi:hypothetical protein